jgi:hypothetical protein
MGLNGNANFQVEFWELRVGWITRPDVISLLNEQPGARADRGEKSFRYSAGICCLAAVVKTSLRVDSPPHEVEGGTKSSAASMAAV